jgi:acetyl/propionyl-CoA carboxylase alpha subunit
VSETEVRIGGEAVEPADGWRLEWTDRRHGIGLLVSGERSIPVVVEGGGSEWTVAIRGRRIPVAVRTWRERLLAEAETSARGPIGALVVRATLPGLVVAVRVAEGDEVGEGDSLLTIEAMKMQNEVRAPRPARVTNVAVAAGQVVATGAELLTLD